MKSPSGPHSQRAKKGEFYYVTERRVVEAAMEQFERFSKKYGGIQQLLKATGTGDKLIKACAALAKARKAK